MIRNGELKAWDATGAELGAALAIDGDESTIMDDDRDAIYPLTIDPLPASPAWTAEADQPFWPRCWCGREE